MKIFVVGSLNMDLVINSPYMPENGVTLHGSGFMTNPGGKGANQAAAVGKLGGNAYMVGSVGEAFGNELKETLKSYNVDVSFVSQQKNISSGIAVIVVVDGDNRIFLDGGANMSMTSDVIEKALNTAQAGDILIVQSEISLSNILYSLKTAKTKGMTTIFNPAPACELPQEIFSCCDYFVPNASEAEFFTGIKPHDDQSIKACAAKLNTMGAKNIIITLGSKGSAFINNEKFFKVDCIKAQAIDTTAAGDTYVGAFAVMLSEGAGEEKAMKFASAASALTVARKGAQQSIPYRNEIKNF